MLAKINMKKGNMHRKVIFTMKMQHGTAHTARWICKGNMCYSNRESLNDYGLPQTDTPCEARRNVSSPHRFVPSTLAYSIRGN
jgi:hypothetical protein